MTIQFLKVPELAVGDQIPQRFNVQTAIPEPSTSAALLAMIAGAVWLRRQVRQPSAD